MTLGWKSGAGSEEEEEEGDGAKESLGGLDQGIVLGGRTLSNSLNNSLTVVLISNSSNPCSEPFKSM